MKILITGNLGYVGPRVTQELRSSYPSAVLVGLDIGYFAHCLTDAARFPEVLLDRQYFADVRQLPGEVLGDVDVVVHLAAISNDPMGKAYEDVTLDINYRACLSLAEQAKKAGVRAFVFASSCSVYGCAEDGPRNETSPLDPLTTYARSKVLSEQALAGLADAQFQVTCLRFATACGMSPRLRLDLVLNDFVASALTKRCITVLSDGTPWRPLIDVGDMARAIQWAIERESSAGGHFLVINAGSDSWNYRVADLAAAVAEMVPQTDVSINRQAPPDKRSYRVDFSRFRALAPHHQPRATLSATIRELVRGLRAAGFNDPDFRNSPLIRLHVLGDLERRGLLDRALRWTEKRAAPTVPDSIGPAASADAIQMA
jgi:nucleoside-diphosphate-sugar epimerase